MSRIIWKEKEIKSVVLVPYCPECGNSLTEEIDPDRRAMYHYYCKHCGYID